MLLDRPYMKGRVNYGLTFDPRNETHWEDTDINTNEPVASGEVAIDVTPDATSAIPVGTTIRIDSEPMSVTATGTTLTVVRKHTVTHSTATDIYKLVNSCVLWLPGQNDPQSAVIRDRSGKGNDGAIDGATWLQTGQGLDYLDFDGGNDLVNCGNVGTTIRTLEFWMYPDSTTESILEETDNVGVTINAGAMVYGSWDDCFVDGVNTDTVTAAWHHIMLTSITNVDMSACRFGLVDATYFNGGLILQRAYTSEKLAGNALDNRNQERHLFGV